MKQVIGKTIFLFLLVQIAALLIGIKFGQKNISVVENSASTENSLYFFATILLFAIILLIILKYYKGKLLFLIVELAMEFTAVQILVSLFTTGAFAFIAAVIVVFLRLAKQEAKQPILLVTVAVVAGLLGASLDILPAVVLAALLAGYDVVAVFYTKHMIALAKQLTERQAAFSIQVNQGKEKLELGTGDVVIPGMLIVSANDIGKTAITYGSSTVSFPALAGLIGAVIGISALLLFLEKRKGYWPALPPITVAAIAGILLATLI